MKKALRKVKELVLIEGTWTKAKAKVLKKYRFGEKWVLGTSQPWFGRMGPDDVSQLASRLEKRNPPVSIPTGVVLNIQGLCFWAGRA